MEARYLEKDREIIMQCRSGVRSALAGETAIKLGYTNVSTLAGGITEMKNQGWEISK